jgi:Flp pilus assembly pilin Flp
MKNLVSRFVKDESGATAIEYGLIAAGIAIAIITAVQASRQAVDQLRHDLDLAEISDRRNLLQRPRVARAFVVCATWGRLPDSGSFRRLGGFLRGRSRTGRFPIIHFSPIGSPDAGNVFFQVFPPSRWQHGLCESMILDIARLMLFPALMAFAGRERPFSP